MLKYILQILMCVGFMILGVWAWFHVSYDLLRFSPGFGALMFGAVTSITGWGLLVWVNNILAIINSMKRQRARINIYDGEKL